MIREQIAERYIRGRGIEIGGRHCPLAVPKGCLVTYVDRLSLEDLKKDPYEKVVENEIVVDDAEQLKKFENHSLDFIVANHVYEHTRNPLKTLCVWRRVLRENGIVYAAIPEKTKTFDSPRAVTPLPHLLEDFPLEETDDAQHYREWFTYVDKIAPELLEKHIADCVRAKTNIHFHVWDRAAMLDIFRWSEDRGLFRLLEMVTNGGEEICVLRAI